jgi:hypothetical protein
MTTARIMVRAAFLHYRLIFFHVVSIPHAPRRMRYNPVYLPVKGQIPMSETRYTLEQDLKEADAMADALVPYLQQDQLYGTLRQGWLAMNQMPSLTVGALLMRLRRLRALADRLTPEQVAQLTAAETATETARREWKLHFERKMTYEAQSRLKAMSTFFEEMRDEPRTAVNSYLPEALRRTIVQEIVLALPAADAALSAEMQRVDGLLRRWTQADTFLWDPILQPVYPQGEFWWLYVRPAPPPGR